jgi:putative pyruvate formate lyase activating enzyme
MGLEIPIVYNTSAFDSLESLELMDGLVDIYLPDFKVWNPDTSKRLLKADNYAEIAMQSIQAMYKQVGDLCFTADGIAKSGLLIRHLVMPGKESEGVEIVKWLAGAISKDTFLHIMEQYTPDAHVGKKNRKASSQANATEGNVRYADINRAVKDSEVHTVSRAARDAGLWRFIEAPKHVSTFVH